MPLSLLVLYRFSLAHALNDSGFCSVPIIGSETVFELYSLVVSIVLSEVGINSAFVDARDICTLPFDCDSLSKINFGNSFSIEFSIRKSEKVVRS